MTAVLTLLILAQSQNVDEALVAFGKAFNGPEEKRLAAIETLRGLMYDKVYAELAKCLSVKESPNVRAKAVEVLGEMDHPTVARILSDAVKPNAETKEVLKAMAKAISKVNWDIFHAALCETILMNTQNPKFTGQKEFSDAAWDYLILVEREAPVAAVDGLLKLFAKYEESRRAGYGTGDWYKKVEACVKACTGVEKASVKEYAAYWKSARAQLAPKFTYSYWCPGTKQRWEKKGSDAKAGCPNHPDKKDQAKEQPALTKNK